MPTLSKKTILGVAALSIFGLAQASSNIAAASATSTPARADATSYSKIANEASSSRLGLTDLLNLNGSSTLPGFHDSLEFATIAVDGTYRGGTVPGYFDVAGASFDHLVIWPKEQEQSTWALLHQQAQKDYSKQYEALKAAVSREAGNAGSATVETEAGWHKWSTSWTGVGPHRKAVKLVAVGPSLNQSTLELWVQIDVPWHPVEKPSSGAVRPD